MIKRRKLIESQKKQGTKTTETATTTATTTTTEILHPKLYGYVGFSNLPNQVHRKSVKSGFQFTCMVAGMCFKISLLE